MEKGKKGSKVFYGWWVVLACSFIGLLSSSARLTFTMFLPTIENDLGWTRAALGFGLTLHMWMYAVIAIVVGFIVDRYGARIVMTLGGFFILIGLLLTSQIKVIWEFYVYFGVILGIGVALTLAVPGMSTARKWFNRKAGLAIAIVAMGGALGLAIMAFVVPGMIDAFGWRNSWFYLGIIMGVSTILSAWAIVRKDPESMGLYPDGDMDMTPNVLKNENQDDAAMTMTPEAIWTPVEAVKTRSFWCFLFAYAIMGIPLMGISGHIAAWGTDISKIAGVPMEEAIGAIKLSIFLMAMMVVFGMLIGGPLSDKVGRKPVFISALLMDVLIFAYAIFVNTLPGFIIASVLLGIIGGLIIPLWSAYLGDIFGRASIATLFGFLTFAVGIIGGTGPVIYGWIFDKTASYNWAWISSGLCCIIALFLVLLIKKEVKDETS